MRRILALRAESWATRKAIISTGCTDFGHASFSIYSKSSIQTWIT